MLPACPASDGPPSLRKIRDPPARRELGLQDPPGSGDKHQKIRCKMRGEGEEREGRKL